MRFVQLAAMKLSAEETGLRESYKAGLILFTPFPIDRLRSWRLGVSLIVSRPSTSIGASHPAGSGEQVQGNGESSTRTVNAK